MDGEHRQTIRAISRVEIGVRRIVEVSHHLLDVLIHRETSVWLTVEGNLCCVERVSFAVDAVQLRALQHHAHPLWEAKFQVYWACIILFWAFARRSTVFYGMEMGNTADTGWSEYSGHFGPRKLAAWNVSAGGFGWRLTLPPLLPPDIRWAGEVGGRKWVRDDIGGTGGEHSRTDVHRAWNGRHIKTRKPKTV